MEDEKQSDEQQSQQSQSESLSETTLRDIGPVYLLMGACCTIDPSKSISRKNI